MIKIYTMTVIQGSITIYSPIMGTKNYLVKVMFLLGLLVFGNIIDNISQPRWFVFSV